MENVHTVSDLKQMQSLPLEAKIKLSQERIRAWYEHWEGEVYVLFSGGKDSTVLLDLVRKMYPDTPAVFVDTGLEYPELREFVKSVENVTWVRPKKNFRQVIEEYGYPVISKEVAKVVKDARSAIQKGNENSYALAQLNGTRKNPKTGGASSFNMVKWKFLLNAPFKISASCCDVMKKRTTHNYEKETGKKGIVGTMADESRLRKTQWLKYGCNVFEGKKQISKPLSFWTEQDIFEYILKYGLPYASVYGDIVQDDEGKYYTTGCDRTGCVFCMFGCHLEKEPNRFQRLKITHPKLWQYCMKPWNEGGLGMAEVLDYISVDYGKEEEKENEQITNSD